jgi:hypothetical protein
MMAVRASIIDTYPNFESVRGAALYEPSARIWEYLEKKWLFGTRMLVKRA